MQALVITRLTGCPKGTTRRFQKGPQGMERSQYQIPGRSCYIRYGRIPRAAIPRLKTRGRHGCNRDGPDYLVQGARFALTFPGCSPGVLVC